MSIFFPEPDIKVGKDGFEGKCDLGRAESGKKLSELVEKISEPVVIAVDGPWGSGKSHFLKLWTGAHTQEEKYTTKVIYFDAFKHDYFDDPLVALMGEITEKIEKDGGALEAVKALWEKLKWLRKPALRGVAAIATKGGTEMAGAVGDAVIEVASKETSKVIDSLWADESSRRAAMEGFKTALKDLTIENGTEEKPQKIVIIIDELDRCRPDFALNMLETIKHFFAVENVIFVLGVNLAELENSVKARYGLQVNAEKYLQKFVHIRFELPLKIGEHQKLDTWKVYYQAASTRLKIPDYLTDHLEKYLDCMHLAEGISIREIQRVLSILVLVPKTTKKGISERYHYGWRAGVVCMIAVKCFLPKIYRKARLGTIIYEDLLDDFEMLNAHNPKFDFYEHRVWAELFDKPWKNNDIDHGQGPFGPGRHVERESFLPQIIEDFLESFELLDSP